jgi:putative transcriptional regulator
MSITHHPPEEFLIAYAAGRLDAGQSLAIATHLEGCSSCRATMRGLEEIAGAALADIEPVDMMAGAFDRLIAGIDDHQPRTQAPARRPAVEPELPVSLRGYALSGWKWVAPGVSMRPILLPEASKTRAFLLKSAQGTNMLQHTHSGIEMTCVLKGSFSHEGGVFTAGDFDYGDGGIDHKPLVGGEEECVCLVAMTGRLQLDGFIGKLIQPFIRL